MLARAADPDPRRNEVRDAVAREDRDALRRWSPRLRRRRAADRHAPASGGGLRDAGLSDETVALLDAGRRLYPGDFWLNHNLGMAFGVSNPPRREEAIRYLTAATALRPDSLGAHLNLGNALPSQGKLDEAIAESA